MIIKPTVQTCNGDGVAQISTRDTDALMALLNQYAFNFIIQEKVSQHPDIQSFNYHFRLPSEAEWEYVATGASQGLPFQRFAGSDNAQIVAWFATNSDGLTHEVGQLQDVAPGIYDLSGNVAEWVQDRYCEYSSKEQKNPVVTSGPSVFVYRGGSFRSSENKLRVTARNADTASYRSPDLGFRLVIEQY